ncbi:alpha-1,4-glucan--maltose-1-phosphate maltosyltransferase [Azohydromonas lata]|uniref:Alpha-1,4-glucan:maltose-1-phosphate maltosyltransferase n=1 Tax=Azohydromonas lata TaxID=45677 RepID=A0ABU5IIM3_9BURK|nr:alpha-1,4-glucan--maltose-1-phosphate maltosyltransferase [Azohydromonas lata]MDZ5458406.1 alpha-1,4-glucan--maltose-1-phosphate maltosyltransferase [Azohydromonas lata]
MATTTRKSATSTPAQTPTVEAQTKPARKRSSAPRKSAAAQAAAPLSAGELLLPRAEAGVSSLPPPGDGRVRVIVDAVVPQVDGGRFAGKCIAGEPVTLSAHAFTDGHDRLRVQLHWRAEADAATHHVEMAQSFNDEWHAQVCFPHPGRYFFGVTAWVDSFSSWRHDFNRRVDEADIRIAAKVGAELIEGAASRAESGEATTTGDAQALRSWAEQLRLEADTADPDALKALALDERLNQLADAYPDKRFAVGFPERPLFADRLRARFSTWYELFPRSASDQPGRHGTFKDVIQRLPYVAAMGFDVLYFPPIHPIGREKRKGPNNTLVAGPQDVGSPWAIGAAEGGHKSIHPLLGTEEDFAELVQAAGRLGIDIALDIALQCAPDHPYVQEHPQWFRWRPDGTVQYAENPPKKYQDIYPFNFETDDWRALWQELKSIFDFWIARGVKVFRVDNPHTKSFAFWEWCISEITREHPDVIFLAEAFTRPKVMHRLAKLGYSQSYTYFTWRNTKAELTAYFTELSQGPGYHWFRPNVWPNTPDILNEHLHHAPRSVFMQRLVLAATLCASYGIYGPAYELMENRPVKPGSEEYLDSEKYQLRHWDLEREDSLQWFIGLVNRIRRDNAALHDNRSLRFMPVDNEHLIAYAKRTPDGRNTVLTVVNLDPDNVQSGMVDVNLQALGIQPDTDYTVHDLLSQQRFTWRNGRNFVQLDPNHTPAHVFVVRQTRRSERDFFTFEG